MMRELEEKKVIGRTRAHSVTLDNRERASITGVVDVDSFNEQEVVAVTDAGYITLLGQDLHIVKLNLDDGQLIVEGFILAMDYGDGDEAGSKKSGFFSRMFH